MACSKSKQKSYIAGFKDISRLTADDFLRVWEHYDADGNGFIEGKELRDFFTELVECHDNPEAISPQMFDEMCNCFMEAYDENADGKIEMKELAELLRPEENFLLLFRTEELRSSVEFMETWRKYDTDKSGYIEAAELKNFIKDLLEKPRSEAVVDSCEEVPETLTEEKLNKYTSIMLKQDFDTLYPAAANKMTKGWINYSTTVVEYACLMVPGWKEIVGIDTDIETLPADEKDNLALFMLPLIFGNKAKMRSGGRCSLTDSMSSFIDAKLLKLFDRNGDGKLEIKEMTRLLPIKENFLMRFEGSLLSKEGIFGGKGDSEGGPKTKKHLTRDEFENVFAHYDKDGNGTIEGDELAGFLKDLMEHENENVDVDSLQSGSQALLSICDVNKDGRIQKDELAMVLLPQPSRTDKE